MTLLQQAIRKTIAYHSLFQYPLTPAQIHSYLIQHKEPHIENIEAELSHMLDLRVDDSHWSLPDIPKLPPTTIPHSWELIKKAQHFANRYFKKIPHIQLIAVSGSTAALNAKVSEDIDLFIITQPHTKWVVRTSMLTLLHSLGERINVHQEENEGKFCANLIIESNDEWKLTNQDIYTAMEIAHLKVLYDPYNTFNSFLEANEWIEPLLPNFYSQITLASAYKKTSVASWVRAINVQLGKIQQRRYAQKHNKTLTLQNDWIYDHRKETLDKYQATLEKLGLE